jgi:hypothetical protein
MAKKRKTDSEPVKAAEEKQGAAAPAGKAASARKKDVPAAKEASPAGIMNKISAVLGGAKPKVAAQRTAKSETREPEARSAAAAPAVAPADPAPMPPTPFRAPTPVAAISQTSSGARRNAGNVQEDTEQNREEIARIAYSYWEQRGYHGGSPDEDWFRAVEEYHRRKAERIHAVVA